MNPSVIQQAADALWQARASRTTIARVSETFGIASAADAYAVAAFNAERAVELGGRISGKKIGLTSLAVSPDGGMQSEGLSLFAGQELRIEPELIADMTAGAKIGVRLIDYMVERGRIDAPQKVTGPDGQPLRLEPSANGRFIRVWRG